MYIGTDLLFPDVSDAFISKNTTAEQIIRGPLTIAGNVKIGTDSSSNATLTVYGQSNFNKNARFKHIITDTLLVNSTSTFIGLITGTITSARYSTR